MEKERTSVLGLQQTQRIAAWSGLTNSISSAPAQVSRGSSEFRKTGELDIRFRRLKSSAASISLTSFARRIASSVVLVLSR